MVPHSSYLWIGMHMKVLFTGMASSHCKKQSIVNFFGEISKLVETFSDVEWKAPSVLWTKDYLDKYDAVFVGIVPPTSPSANKLYGAMHVIDLLFESPKLTLVIDHPQLWQFKHGFSSISKNVDNIFSKFYSLRKEFSLAKEAYLSSILSANEKLLSKEWPKTIYPSLPWNSKDTMVKNLDGLLVNNLIGINIDSWLINEPKTSSVRNRVWVADHPKTKWTTSISKLLEFDVLPLKEHRKSSQNESELKLKNNFGLLLSPQDRGVGVWWSYQMIQAINTGTPILSNWQETKVLGNSWNLLGSDLESADSYDILDIVNDQRESYIRSIPNKGDSIESLKNILNISLNGEKNA